MSCTHDCGCMADFDAPQAPGQGEDSLSPSEPVFIDPATLAPGTAVEIKWPTTRDRFLYYADEGGYQITAGKVGNGDPYPWKDGRIVRVFTEDKPMQEPVLPRPITPEDVRVGMIIERRKGECYVGGRVTSIDGSRTWLGAGVVAWVFGAKYAERGWSLWLVEDAPEPVDPDADVIERMAEAMWRIEEKPPTDYDGAVDDPEGWQELAHAALLALRETHDVTARAEQ